MKYDPIKNIIGNTVRTSVTLRKIFYRILGIMFLREWHVKRALRQILGKSAGRPFHVLDAGSGFGQYSYFLARTFPEVVIHAVDVKEEQIEDCRRFFQKTGLTNVTFAVEDLTAMQHENRFDLILSVDVMEHIEDDSAVFRGFRRALKQGGAVIINTPSAEPSDGKDEPKSFIDEHARYGYSPQELRSKLEAAGLVLDDVKFTYGTWGGIAWRIGIKFPMFMLNLSKLFFLLLPFYYLAAFPLAVIFMTIEYYTTVKAGGGLLALARKP